jgi:hypothetical protein
MARPVNATVTCEVLATETGLWCDSCALPSGVSFLVALSGVSYSVLAFTRCRDCHEPCEPTP